MFIAGSVTRIISSVGAASAVGRQAAPTELGVFLARRTINSALLRS